jgi:hypothetical protein
MAANPTVKCPTCKQDNAPDMAFCIYCGANMKVKASPTATATAQSVELDDTSETQLRICPKCQSADPLNQDYCIVCGSKIPKRERIRGVTSSVMVQSELLNLKDEISTIQAVRSQQAPKPFRVPTALMLVALSALGIGLGVLGGLAQERPGPEKPPEIALPTEGLTILTAQPYCDISVESSDHRDFYIGRTGKTGDLAMEKLVPDTYQVEVKNPQGEKETRSTATVLQNQPYILGGPPGPRLFQATSPTEH